MITLRCPMLKSERCVNVARRGFGEIPEKTEKDKQDAREIRSFITASYEVDPKNPTKVPLGYKIAENAALQEISHWRTGTKLWDVLMAAMVPLFSDETKPSLAEKDDVSQVAYYRSRATADDMALEAERSAQRQEDDRGYRQRQQQKEQIERKVKQIVTDCLLL